MSEYELYSELQNEIQKFRDKLNNASILLLNDLMKKSPKERLSIISALDDSTLKSINTNMAIPLEYYEICAIVKKVSDERGLK